MVQQRQSSISETKEIQDIRTRQIHADPRSRGCVLDIGLHVKNIQVHITDYSVQPI